MRSLIAFLVAGSFASAGDFANGFQNARAVGVSATGQFVVADAGAIGTPGDGTLSLVADGKATVFAKGLDDPEGLVYSKLLKAWLVLERDRVVKVTADGKSEVLIANDKFPKSLERLKTIALDEPTQSLVVAGAGERNAGTIFKYDLKKKTLATLRAHLGGGEKSDVRSIVFDGSHCCILADGKTLNRIWLTEEMTMEWVYDGKNALNGLAWDAFGRLYFLDGLELMAIPRPEFKRVPVQVATLPAVKGFSPHLAVPSLLRSVLHCEGGTVKAIPAVIPGWEVDEKPLPVAMVPAFAGIKWTGWDDGSETGKAGSHRPIVLTHAGDGSNRIFVGLQQGTVHIIENDKSTATKLFLDISKKVRYADKQNEEGLLGLCFHPKFKENGEFFVFYTDAAAKLTNVVSRFKVKKDNRNQADPDSEEVILKIEKPYWNHDGGTIAFGPDGYLYITHGDGGLGNDPHANGQNLKTFLGKILRIDVDRKEKGRNYAIPADNPFRIDSPDYKHEIYAYGLRNCWRFAFDKPTGMLWAADVGQNLYEEINIIKKGGNYGWGDRESFHPFGPKGKTAFTDLEDPIWEYHHDLGKSITGGHVYRGTAVPDLQGLYLYADYVTPNVWALRYDAEKKRTVANHPLGVPNIAVMSFGEDEAGESYILGATPNARGIYRFAKK